MKTLNKCTEMETKLAELLLDPDSASAKVKTHVAECNSCRTELEELRATMGLLDGWVAPEPSPPPASWLERLRARLTYGPPMHARPLAAMALTLMLLLGGGTYLGVTNWEQPPAPQGDAAVVHDLQTLENNAQLLDQLESITDNPNIDDSEYSQ